MNWKRESNEFVRENPKKRLIAIALGAGWLLGLFTAWVF